MELITRRTIKDLEGIDAEAEVPQDVLDRYADPNTKEHENMVDSIRKQLHFDSLRFQKLDDLLEATGVDKCNLCTYCWDGKE